MANGTFYQREGIIIAIEGEGYTGYGETAPLPGFSSEQLFECRNQIEGFIFAVKDDQIDISVEDLLLLADVHTCNYPSAQFGLETALYDLAAKFSGKSLASFLNSKYSESIFVNGLAGIHSPENGFPIIKVKTGFRNLFDEIEYMEKLSLEFDDDILFRLDCNESLDLPRAIRFCKEMEKFNIEYIEQPLPRNDLEDLCELRFHTEIPIAVDESLTDKTSAEKLIESQAADVFIIKPTMTGSYKTCEEIITLSRMENIKPIITSSIENIIGLTACAHLSAAHQIEDACGLATLDLLSVDSQSAPIKNGRYYIPDNLGLGVEPAETI